MESVLEIPGPLTGGGVLVHSDFCPDHLLVDPVSGHLRGIIDWTDAGSGDPVVDFVVLAAWKGRRFVDRVLASYTRVVDGGFRRRLAFDARVNALLWLHSSVEQQSDTEKHIRWIVNAFETQDGR